MAERQLLRLFLLSALLLGGCSPWLRPAVSDKALPAPLMSPETIILEVAFVHLTPDDSAIETATWQHVDEQMLAVDVRQRLAGNGLRAGALGSQLPPELRHLVERTAQELTEAPAGDDVTTAETTTLARNRRMQVRAGRRGKIVVSAVAPNISVLAKDDQGRVQGEAFRDAQCLFSLLANPSGDSRTKLQLTPEVEHGDLQNRWVPVDGALVQQVGKPRHVYDQLRIELPLAPGQTLIIGPTEQAGGLGQHFFTLSVPIPRRTLLLVRIAQTQQDDLFRQPDGSTQLISAAD